MDGYLEERNTLTHGLALVCIILIGLIAVASAIPSSLPSSMVTSQLGMAPPRPGRLSLQG